MAVNKVVYGGSTLIDLTSDTVSPETLASGVKAHNAKGEQILGEMLAGGMPDGVAYGEVQITNTSTSTMNVNIVTTDEVGFVPTHFYLWRENFDATANSVHSYQYDVFGTQYNRKNSRYANNTRALSAISATTNWTTNTAGHLYLSGKQISVRSTSSYICRAGKWKWIAIR